MTDAVIAPNPHAEPAKALLDKIRALRAEIPRFRVELPEEKIRMAGVASVPDPFLESASVTVERSERLEVAANSNAPTLRDAFAYSLAYDAVVQELGALQRDMAHTIRFERARAALSALDIYAIARRMAKQKDGAELIPHVQDMRRKLKRGRRKATSQPAPDPAAPKDAVKT